MSSIEDKLASDKCCFFVPIVPGMKILTGVMILTCVLQVIGLITSMAKGMGWFLVILALADIVFCFGVIYFLGMWFKENSRKSRQGLVNGLMVNIAQNLFGGIVLIIAAYGHLPPEVQASFDANKGKAEAKLTKEQQDLINQYKGHAGTAAIIATIVSTGLATYFWTEAKEYQKLADAADSYDKVDDE